MIPPSCTVQDDDDLCDIEDDDDPKCPECGCDLFSENHDWDCGFAGDDDDDELGENA